MAGGREPAKVLRNLALKGLALGLERGCRLAVTLFSAPILGETAFGRFVFASTVTAFLALAADLGLGLWTTRALATGRTEPAEVVRIGLMLRGATTLPYALAVGVVALATEGETRIAIVLLGVAALFNAFADHFGAILRGTERFALEARMNAVRALLMVVAGVSALAVGRSLTALAAAMAASGAAAFVYGVAVIARVHGLSWWAARVDRSSSLALARTALRGSLPIWLAGLVSLLYFKVDTLFVRWLAGDAELGAYGAAYKLFEGAMLLPSVVLAVTFPRLVRAEADVVVRDRLERRIAGGLLAAGLVVSAVFFLGRTPLVHLFFGSGFRRAEDSLRILALGLPLVFLNYGLTHFLIARHRERVNTVLAVMMLAVVVTLDLVLIPRGSGPGAAAATSLAEVALTTGCLLALAMATRPRLPLRSSPGQGAPRTDRTPA